jgi:hypothetical protein
MQALQLEDQEVPYGDSCLTRLLADSMGGGSSRAILIAACRCAQACMLLLPCPLGPAAR